MYEPRHHRLGEPARLPGRAAPGQPLSGAARSLGVAQPTVRRRLDALERSVGVALFTRSPSGLSPTDAARELAAHAGDHGGCRRCVLARGVGGSDAASGVVRVSASVVIGALVHLPQMFTRLQPRCIPDWCSR